MNKIRNWGAATLATLSVPMAAHAEVPAAVTTALGDLSADAVTVAGLVLAALVAVYAFKFMRRGL